MNNILTFCIAGIMLASLPGCSSEQNSPAQTRESASSIVTSAGNGAEVEENIQPGKVLVAYFSHTGNTKYMAEQIQQNISADSFELVPANDYPLEYSACTKQAKEEQDSDARPALAYSLENIQDYDTVFVGYPIWWGSAPMPVLTFLESYDFSDKTIVPFCTHQGSELGKSEAAIQKAARNSQLKEGLAVRGSDVRDSEGEILAWLSSLGFA